MMDVNDGQFGSRVMISGFYQFLSKTVVFENIVYFQAFQIVPLSSALLKHWHGMRSMAMGL